MTVTDVVAERIAEDTGFSALLYRLHLTGGQGVPATLIAKLPAQSAAPGAMELLGGYRRELTFYADVAGRAPMGTPRVYAARMAENSVDFVLLLEDLGAWDNADHLAGLSVHRAELAISVPAVAYLMVLPVITLIGWDALPERSRQLCLTLTDRAVAAIDDIDASEEFT